AALASPEPPRAKVPARPHAAARLAGNATLALAEHVIHGGCDRGEDASRLAFRRERSKSIGKFLRQKGGRELARLPPRMLHQRRQERNVVAEPLDGKSVERVGLGSDR